jgi:hypothetical protein
MDGAANLSIRVMEDRRYGTLDARARIPDLPGRRQTRSIRLPGRAEVSADQLFAAGPKPRSAADRVDQLNPRTPTEFLNPTGSIGLGHAGRDLAIANELRRLNSEIEIVWLAGDPARRLLAEAGETLLPQAAAFAEETGPAEAAADGFSLNIVNFASRVARGAWKRAVAAFEEANASYPYDLLVGDESYEVAMALADRPELKKAPFALIYDFVGMDATTWSPLERLIAYRINWLWSGGPSGKPPSEDRVLFIGEPEDVADRPFGLPLPNRRDIPALPLRRVRLPLRPRRLRGHAKLRAALGYDERPLVLCSVGGTAVGADVLRPSCWPTRSSG